MEEYSMMAKTFQGLEEILAQELIELGANNVQIGRRMVAFDGDKALMYRANFCLRTALRILRPIKQFKAQTADEVYNTIKSIHWEDYLDCNKTFAVNDTVYSNEFRHSKFVAYKVKDAIADYFREKTGNRPTVRLNNPDIQLDIHISETDCTLSLDSSGESLHRRGYRQEAVEAPLNEVLAAGMIMKTGWKGECDFIDPMCGSGTLPIEACLIAQNIAPGVFRKGYAFERWNDFDADLLEQIYNDDSAEREMTCHIFAYDVNPKAIGIARCNAKAAGLLNQIHFETRDFKDFEQPTEKSIIITNPPYGERISTENILGLYEMIGERLKHAFMGNDAWVLSYHYECFDKIGLKPSQKIPLYNGALECEFRQYQIFGGKYKAFRNEGGQIHEDECLQPKPAKRDFREKRKDERNSFHGYRRNKFEHEQDHGFESENKYPRRKWNDETEKPWQGERTSKFTHNDGNRKHGFAAEDRPIRRNRYESNNTHKYEKDFKYSTHRFDDHRNGSPREEAFHAGQSDTRRTELPEHPEHLGNTMVGQPLRDASRRFAQGHRPSFRKGKPDNFERRNKHHTHREPRR